MAYSGMPSHYPHWSYGKSYEKLKTLYDHGVSGLPYEMVINSNPALAYLMRDNTLLLQILTIAHVYGHNDFFKNNFTYRTTRAELTIELFKAHALRVRHYAEDPSIGIEKVETCSTRRTRCSWQCRRNLAIRKLSHDEQLERLIEAAHPKADPFLSHPCPRGGSRARHPQGPARARRGPAAVHPRPQSVSRRMGKGPAHHRGRGSEVLPPDDRDQDHERGMGELLAQAHPGVAQSRTGPAPGIHRAPQPGRAPDSGPAQSLPPRVQNLGGHPSPPHRSDGRGNQARRSANQKRRRQNLRGARGRTRQFLFAPLPDRRADARDGSVQVRGARRRSGDRQGLRRRRLARGQGNAHPQRRRQARSR